MEISRVCNDSELTITLVGRLDSTTTPQLEAEVNNLDGVKSLILDFAGLEYISSAGLRVVLLAQKKMKENGKMVVRSINPNVQEVFDITGFSKILTIV